MPDYFEEQTYGEGECSCRYHGLGGNDPDTYWTRDKWCPVHGADPDVEALRRREDRGL